MIRVRTALAGLLSVVACVVVSGCGDGGTDYGAFSYKAPDGWTKHEPMQGISIGEGVVRFYPDVEVEQGTPSLEFWEMPEQSPRTERVADLYARVREGQWRNESAQAERDGQPTPAFKCEPVSPIVSGSTESQGYAFLIERMGETKHRLVHWFTLPDGRSFRAMYAGADPEFSQHLNAITASLESLTFEPAPPAGSLPLGASVAAIAEHLDGERLWIVDGKVNGRVLNDEHLKALADPEFAGVTDLNLVADYNAMSIGVNVTDAGLAHFTHLPLESLCMRGSLVTDAGLAHLKDMPIQVLVLGGTLVTGDGLAHLTGMPLKVLDLEGTDIDDDDLQHLAGMKLKNINLRNTRVTQAGFDAFKELAPDVYVSFE